jgi:hypothetical protein
MGFAKGFIIQGDEVHIVMSHDSQHPAPRYGRGRAFTTRQGNYLHQLVNRPMSRREMMRWIVGLAGVSAGGASGLFAFLQMLYARRQVEADRLALVARTAIPPAIPLATPEPPPLVSRARWNARPVNHNALNEFGFASPTNPDGWLIYTGDLTRTYSTVAIHHSYPIRGDIGTMRQIQDVHLDVRKWADIGYHFAVGRDGAIYEGRDIRARGANVAGYNTGTIGVVGIGDFNAEMPTPLQLTAMVTLIRWLRAAYLPTHLAGHGEFSADTVCPGANMRPYLDRLAQVCELTRGVAGRSAFTHIAQSDTRAGCC